MRNWVAARCDPYNEPIPAIPDEVIEQTSQVYIKAFETITGKVFEAPAAGVPPLERIRRNLARYF